MTRWTEADLVVIAEAAGDDDRDRAMESLRAHFGGDRQWLLGFACQAADGLIAGRAVRSTESTAVVSRDFGPLSTDIRQVS